MLRPVGIYTSPFAKETWEKRFDQKKIEAGKPTKKNKRNCISVTPVYGQRKLEIGQR